VTRLIARLGAVAEPETRFHIAFEYEYEYEYRDAEYECEYRSTVANRALILARYTAWAAPMAAAA
jgi:hypothetical protein